MLGFVRGERGGVYEIWRSEGFDDVVHKGRRDRRGSFGFIGVVGLVSLHFELGGGRVTHISGLDPIKRSSGCKTNLVELWT